MIIAIIKESEPGLRQQMEEHLVGDLKTRGYNAHSAIAKYGGDGFYKIDSITVYNKLRHEQVDGVLTIVLLNKSTKGYYVPRRGLSPGPGRPDQMWDYHKDLFNRIESDGYFHEATKYFWESNFYDLNTKELIYMVRTQSFDPSSINTLSHHYGLHIVRDMVRKRVLHTAGSAHVESNK